MPSPLQNEFKKVVETNVTLFASTVADNLSNKMTHLASTIDQQADSNRAAILALTPGAVTNENGEIGKIFERSTIEFELFMPHIHRLELREYSAKTNEGDKMSPLESAIKTSAGYRAIHKACEQQDAYVELHLSPLEGLQVRIDLNRGYEQSPDTDIVRTSKYQPPKGPKHA